MKRHLLVNHNKNVEISKFAKSQGLNLINLGLKENQDIKRLGKKFI